MGEQKRKVIDCRKVPSAEKNCTLAIAGTEAEVLELAIHHAIMKHGHKDSPELRDQILQFMQDEK